MGESQSQESRVQSLPTVPRIKGFVGAQGKRKKGQEEVNKVVLFVSLSLKFGERAVWRKEGMLVCTMSCSDGDSVNMSGGGQEVQSTPIRSIQPVCTFTLASIGLPNGPHRHRQSLTE